MAKPIRIGTRESQLAVWQATSVLHHLNEKGLDAELVFIKSEGDIDLSTPLYEMGVQGIFTKTLDIALLNNTIDIAVHSMKDVPTQLAQGIRQAAVLKRASFLDVLVYRAGSQNRVWSRESGVGSPDAAKTYTSTDDLFTDYCLQTPDSRPPTPDSTLTPDSDSRLPTPDSRLYSDSRLTIASSSIRRKAQWLHRYPNHQMVNLRGNVNTRLRKVEENDWQGAIFAAAGLERINLRPPTSIDLDWMLPAPAQGAIMVVCREYDELSFQQCQTMNHEDTALCTSIERAFLRSLLGGCSTPISALAEIEQDELYFRGNLLSPDGKHMASIEKILPKSKAHNLGSEAATEILEQGGQEIITIIRNEAQ